MRIDEELIKRILTYYEGEIRERRGVPIRGTSGYVSSDRRWNYHVKHLIEGGYLEGSYDGRIGPNYAEINVRDLTFKGHNKLKEMREAKKEKANATRNTNENNNNPTVTINISALTKLINEMFDKDELKTLCLHLNLDADEFPEKKSGMVREIVKHMKRQNRLLELVKESFSMNEGQSIKFIHNCLE